MSLGFKQYLSELKKVISLNHTVKYGEIAANLVNVIPWAFYTTYSDFVGLLYFMDNERINFF